MDDNYPDMVKKLEIGKELNDNDKKKLDECIAQFFKEKKR